MNRGDVEILTSSAFDLPEQLAAKADPALIGDDERHFAAIGAALDASIADLSTRLAEQMRAPGARGQAVMERDLEIHRLTSRLNALRRYNLDLCLGRMVPANGDPPIYVGRLGLTDPDGDRLLVDWRSPAAEPFFGATHATPMGLASRRRYRWTRGRISDYWDEVFDDALDGHAALDDQSAFLASLGSSRSDRMRDVLATIAADQDAIIRASAKGALIVDGGPGTGKTVVALHRAAYLLHADPRLQQQRRGGVLVVGPSRPYLTYVADVLPSLGEDGVRTATLRDLVPEGATAPAEQDPEVARLKAALDPAAVLDAAVSIYEEPPTTTLAVDTQWDEIHLTPADWAEAFEAAETGTPHNDAREPIWAELVRIVMDKHTEEDVPEQQLRRVLNQHTDLRETFNRAWPLLEPNDIVGDLWSVPAYLRKCAPELEITEIRRLQREDASAWTLSDLPLLDAARQRLGDPDAALTKRRRATQAAAAAEEMQRVVETIIEADDDGEAAVTMLRGEDLVEALADESALDALRVDALAGPFAHIVVDEAQELTDAEWQMLLSRCPSRSFTIVGDRAQARHGFTESWQERLKRVGFDHLNLASLSINYRTPAEIMAEAEPVIRAAIPDANVPTSIRSSGIPVRHGRASEVDGLLEDWLAENAEGVACVIGDPSFRATDRVRSLTPELAKGLEFDLVVLVDPDRLSAVDRYVALTRSTRELAVLTTG